MQMVSREEIKLVGIKVVGRRSELSHRVPLAWLELKAGLDAIENQVHPDLFYGVFPESDHKNDGSGGVYTYWVATEVSAFGSMPAGMVALTLPARRYAVATVKGRAEQIEPAYIALFRALREQGLTTDPEACGFELYDQKRQAPTPPYEQFDYDIYKPLA